MNRLEEIKKRRAFAVWDLLIYGLVIAFVLMLFVLFVFRGGGEKAQGIEVLVNDKRVYSFRYGEGGEIAEGFESRVIEREEDGVFLVTVYLDDDKREYNMIEINPEKCTAVMRDATCSFRKDCTHMTAISTARGVIVCLPHSLKILPLGYEEEFHPSLG